MNNEHENLDTDELLPTQNEYEKRSDKLAAFLRAETKTKRSWFRRPSGVAAIAAAALTVSVGVAGAAGLFSADDVAVEAGINCYKTASLDSESVGLQPQKNPVKGCEGVWNDGTLSDGTNAPPQMVACVTEGSPVDVFPGTAGTCGDLGLKDLPKGYAPRAKRSVAIESILNRVSKVVERKACVDPNGLFQKATSALHKAGYDDPIDLIGTKPCANYATSIGTGTGTGTGTGKLRIETVSRQEALKYFELIRATKLQGKLTPKGDCVDPKALQAKLREAFDSHGLSDVGVLVDGDGACLDQSSGEGNSEDPSITLVTKGGSSARDAKPSGATSTEANQGMTLDHPTGWSATFDGHNLYIKVQCPDKTKSCAVTAAAVKKGFRSQFGEPLELEPGHSGFATSVVKPRLRGSLAREANAEGSIPFEYRATTDASSGTHLYRRMLRVNWQNLDKAVGKSH